MKELKFVANLTLERKDIKGFIDDWLENNIDGGHATVTLDGVNVVVNIYAPPNQPPESYDTMLNMLRGYVEAQSCRN